jgi:cytochrome c-type biogenesis protein CcmH
MITFVAVAIGMTLAAIALVVTPLLRSGTARAPVAALITALVVPAAAIMLYVSLTSYPWVARTTVSSAAGADTAPITELERRAAEQPEQAAVWITLAEHYTSAERFSEARDAYARALAIEPQNTDARLGSAEAAIMLDRNALAGEAGRAIEDVLAAEPDNAKALWYSGIAALGRGANDIVRDRWQRLLALAPPEQVRQIIEGQLAQLDAAAGDPGDAATTSARIEVHVSIPPAMAGKVKPGAALFLIARDPDRPGPPVAVVRGDAASLPSLLAITDADLMVPGTSLSSLDRVSLTARIANGGEALARPGDVFGEVIWTRGGARPPEIMVDQIVP